MKKWNLLGAFVLMFSLTGCFGGSTISLVSDDELSRETRETINEKFAERVEVDSYARVTIDHKPYGTESTSSGYFRDDRELGWKNFSLYYKGFEEVHVSRKKSYRLPALELKSYVYDFEGRDSTTLVTTTLYPYYVSCNSMTFRNYNRHDERSRTRSPSSLQVSISLENGGVRITEHSSVGGLYMFAGSVSGELYQAITEAAEDYKEEFGLDSEDCSKVVKSRR